MDLRLSILVHVLFMLWAPFVCVGEVTGTPCSRAGLWSLLAVWGG